MLEEEEFITYKKRTHNMLFEVISTMIEYNGVARQRGASVSMESGKFYPANLFHRYYIDINSIVQDYMKEHRKNYVGKYTIIVTTEHHEDTIRNLIREEGFRPF